jgi:hypothetical protein
MTRESHVTHVATFVLFGVLIGTISHAVMTTPRGRQLQHDASRLLDDFVSLCDVVLDTETSYEATLEGVSSFVQKSFSNLENLGAFEEQRDDVPVINEYVATVSREPVVVKEVESRHEKSVDSEIAILKRISRGLR